MAVSLYDAFANSYGVTGFGYVTVFQDGDWTVAAPDFSIGGHVLDSPAPTDLEDAKDKAVAYLSGSSKFRISNWHNLNAVTSRAIFVQGKD